MPQQIHALQNALLILQISLSFNMVDFKILQKYFTEYLVSNPFDLFVAISCFIPLIVVLSNFQKIWSKSKVLVIYVFLILLLELIGNYYAAHSWNNHLFYIVFYFLESICLYLYFKNTISNSFINKIHFVILILVLFALLFNAINNHDQINDYSGSIQSIGFICISLVSYYYILAQTNIKNLFESAFFWINTGSFIYFSGVLFVFLFITKIMAENNDGMVKYYDIFSALVIVFRIFLAIGISKIVNQKNIK